jgi:hypothetical protein
MMSGMLGKSSVVMCLRNLRIPRSVVESHGTPGSAAGLMEKPLGAAVVLLGHSGKLGFDEFLMHALILSLTSVA